MLSNTQYFCYYTLLLVLSVPDVLHLVHTTQATSLTSTYCGQGLLLLPETVLDNYFIQQSFSSVVGTTGGNMQMFLF